MSIVFAPYTSPVRAAWNKVCWSPELNLFCAVAGSTLDNVNTRIMTSPDGITWTTRSTPAGLLYTDVCWSPSLGLFCAVANSTGTDSILTSTNGITWTQRDTGNSFVRLKAIAWSPSLSRFIAAGKNLGPDGLGTKFVLYTSTNGTSWSAIGLSAATTDTVELDGILWAPGLNRFVAWGFDGAGWAIFLSNTGAGYILWETRIASPIVYGDGDTLKTIAWSEELGLLVAAGLVNSTTSFVATSPNGSTWTSRTIPEPSGGKLSINALTWSAETQLFLGVGLSEQSSFPFGPLAENAVTSSDGITWALREAPSNLPFNSIVWAPEPQIFVSVGSNRFTVGNNILSAEAPIIKDITRGIFFDVSLPTLKNITRAISFEVIPYRNITRAINIKLARVVSVLRSIAIRAAVPFNISRAIVINSNLFGVFEAYNKWTAKVFIDGVNYSSRLTGRITVRRAVNAATIADLTIAPETGAINPIDFDGKLIEINYQDQRGESLIFKGRIIKPTIDMANRQLNLTCSDLLQETISKLSQAQINALIPHHRSPAIYRDNEDNYNYALECLNSAEGDIFLGLDNEPIFAAWTDTAPIEFTASNIVYGSVIPTFADRHTLVNKINIELDYRHLIGWHRAHDLKWGIGLTPFGWLSQHFGTLPTVEMIKAAIPSDLVIVDEDFQDPPPTGFYGTGTNIIGWLNGFPPGHTAFSFEIEAAERWLQTVTHKITLSVKATASVDSYDEIERDLKYSVTSDDSGITFANIGENKLFGTSAGFDNSGSVAVSDKFPPDDEDNLYFDWRVKTYRKKLFGKNNTEALAAGAINCLLREAARTILETHQNVTVSFSAPINPLLSLKNNAEINAAGVTATGRIKVLEHRLSIDDGSAITAIELVPVSGAVNQTLTVPGILDNAPASVGGTAPELKTYLGGEEAEYDFITGSWNPLDDPPPIPPDNETWRGYVGNHIYQSDYQERFVVEIPEVADNLRDELIIEQSNAFTLNVTLDKIGLTI
jgi:hypothetical protein